MEMCHSVDATEVVALITVRMLNEFAYRTVTATQLLGQSVTDSQM